MSVDPLVRVTNQPYVFTDDDPLNSEDPLGLMPLRPTAANSHITTSEAKGVAQSIVKELKSNGVPVTNAAATVLSKTIETDTSKPGEVITQTDLSTLEKDVGAASSDVAVVTDIIAAYATTIDDVQAGHSVAYALGDGAVQWGAAAAGFTTGAEACAELGEGAVVCGVANGVAASGIAHWLYHNLI
jgi:hypothetical protein